jgi:multidrug efflux pump subunit AcrB
MDNTTISLELPSGTPAAITDSLLQTIEAATWRVNENYKKDYHTDINIITGVARKIGPETNKGQVNVNFIPGEMRKVSSLQITDLIRRETGKIPQAVNLEFGRSSHWGKPISVAIIGDDLQEMRAAKEDLKKQLRKIKALKDVIDNDTPGLREVNIVLKPKALALGLTPLDVMNQVRAGFFGAEAQRIQRGIDEVRIYVRYKESERASLRQLANMRIRLPNNREYPLQEIATLTVKRGIMSINHLNTRRVIKVEADVSNPKESVTDLNANLKANIIPVLQERYPDLEFSFEGQSRESMKTKRSTLRVLPPILLLMFIIVVINFRSFAQAIIVFSLIPFGLVGIVWGHYIQGYILSVLSMFGMIALAGIMVNDALVLVSAMNQRLKDGQDFKTALYEAGISRFRPILLTSLTTIAGLGPLIFEKSFQAQFLSPMAISVAYGLLFATFLNLLLLPALLTLVNKFKVYGFWLFKGQKPQPKDVEPAVREEAFIKEL